MTSGRLARHIAYYRCTCVRAAGGRLLRRCCYCSRTTRFFAITVEERWSHIPTPYVGLLRGHEETVGEGGD